jgi:hypothetical protein
VELWSRKRKRNLKNVVSFSDTSSSDIGSSNYTYNTRKGKHVSNSSESDNSSDYECKKRHKKYKTTVKLCIFDYIGS